MIFPFPSQFRFPSPRTNALTFILVAIAVIPCIAVENPKPASHVRRQIEGWNVDVDSRLLEESNQNLGKQALRLLEHELFEISFVLSTAKVSELQKIRLQLDLHHGGLKNMQYHPSAGWLTTHGYDKALAKCVHIPDAAYFSSHRDHLRQPCAVLHELAHAYHDQVIGFDDPQSASLWKNFCKSGKYKAVLQIEGYMEPHYALTNAREFFAEMTETYVGENDFYPFNRAELNREEPEIYRFMEQIWGRLPRGISSGKKVK
jgi:hypothetical protein